jgi:hypothetical protein
MNAVIEGTTCPVILHAVEPLVLHPRYHALRVEARLPELGVHVLTPVCRGSRAAFERDGIDGIVVVWVGDIMESVGTVVGTPAVAVDTEIDS